jgi:drug/metabolite transporter (DMT)-like permease
MSSHADRSAATRAYAGALFAVGVWGASFIATKIAVRETDPFTVICLRFGIGVLVLAAAVAHRREFHLPGRADLLRFLALGAVGITAHQALQVTGLVTAQASTTSWIITATPLTMAVVGWIVLRERLGWRQAAGISLGAAGVLLVVSKGEWRGLWGGTTGTIGDLLVSASTITWALFSVYSRQSLQRHRAAPMLLCVMTGGWLLAVVPWVAAGGLGGVGRLNAAGWVSIVFLGVFCSGLAYIYWYDALRVLPTARVGSLLYLEPIVTMAVAAVVLGERVTLASVAGGLVILAGVRVATLPVPEGG